VLHRFIFAVKISIDLQEGFSGDEVILREGGKEIYHARNVTTKTQIGLADTFTAELSAGKTILNVIMPSRHIEETREILPAENLHIAVSVTPNNKLEWKLSDSPFYYM
jgi:flagellar motor switch protein FliM